MVKIEPMEYSDIIDRMVKYNLEKCKSQSCMWLKVEFSNWNNQVTQSHWVSQPSILSDVIVI